MYDFDEDCEDLILEGWHDVTDFTSSELQALFKNADKVGWLEILPDLVIVGNFCVGTWATVDGEEIKKEKVLRIHFPLLEVPDRKNR